MNIGLAIHKAFDFCDRCPIEATLNGRPEEWGEHWMVKIWNKLCPVQYLFKLLPEEEHVNPRKIMFPRRWLEGTHLHYAEQDGIRC